MKALKTPTINATGMPGFLEWAKHDNPALYRSLVVNFPVVAAYDEAGDVKRGLAGLWDSITDIGTSLENSASSIASFVAKNALPIATAAMPVLVAAQQAKVANAQVKLAQARQAPMQTATTVDANGNVITVPIAPRGFSTNTGIPMWVWIAGAGVAGLLVYMILKRK